MEGERGDLVAVVAEEAGAGPGAEPRGEAGGRGGSGGDLLPGFRYDGAVGTTIGARIMALNEEALVAWMGMVDANLAALGNKVDALILALGKRGALHPYEVADALKLMPKSPVSEAGAAPYGEYLTAYDQVLRNIGRLLDEGGLD